MFWCCVQDRYLIGQQKSIIPSTSQSLKYQHFCVTVLFDRWPSDVVKVLGCLIFIKISMSCLPRILSKVFCNSNSFASLLTWKTCIIKVSWLSQSYGSSHIVCFQIDRYKWQLPKEASIKRVSLLKDYCHLLMMDSMTGSSLFLSQSTTLKCEVSGERINFERFDNNVRH